MKDLLQTPDLIPEKILEILSTFDEDDGDAYEECEKLVDACKKEGYHLDYDLSGTIFDLYKL